MVEKIREEFMYMDAVNYISDVLQKTKGFINSIIVTEKSNDNLVGNLKSWLM